MIDAAMYAFVKRFAEEHDPLGTKLETRFPFRRLYEHGFRCAKCAERISAVEGGDAEVAVVSALFHDIGKSVDNTRPGHAEKGAEICGAYLASVGFDREKAARIVAIVRNHIHHGSDGPIEALVESDADLLDETGAMTVLWDAMAVGADKGPSYMAACERIRKTYEALASRPDADFKTRTGKRIFRERMDVLGEFLKSLSAELGLA